MHILFNISLKKRASHKVCVRCALEKSFKRVKVITNLCLSLIVIAILLVSFLPEKTMPMYGSDTFSAIYNGNRNKRQISIMINVYENKDVVNSMLDTLKKHDAKATFFVGGCWADDNAETLNRIVDEGHELGNHGYFHKDHKKLDYDANSQEISLTGKMVKALCGVELNLFAPPSGSFSENTLKCAYELGYRVIMWSKDTIDWRDKNESLVFKRATDNISNGDLVLMHPKQHTLNTLDKILTYYNDVGFKVVTVSQNLAE